MILSSWVQIKLSLALEIFLKKSLQKWPGAIAQFVDDLTNYSKFMGLNQAAASARNISEKVFAKRGSSSSAVGRRLN
jgi:hypothetical protein